MWFLQCGSCSVRSSVSQQPPPLLHTPRATASRCWSPTHTNPQHTQRRRVGVGVQHTLTRSTHSDDESEEDDEEEESGGGSDSDDADDSDEDDELTPEELEALKKDEQNIKVEVIFPGDNERYPRRGDIVRVHYTSYLADGMQVFVPCSHSAPALPLLLL